MFILLLLASTLMSFIPTDPSKLKGLKRLVVNKPDQVKAYYHRNKLNIKFSCKIKTYWNRCEDLYLSLYSRPGLLEWIVKNDLTITSDVLLNILCLKSLLDNNKQIYMILKPFTVAFDQILLYKVDPIHWIFPIVDIVSKSLILDEIDLLRFTLIINRFDLSYELLSYLKVDRLSIKVQFGRHLTSTLHVNEYLAKKDTVCNEILLDTIDNPTKESIYHYFLNKMTDKCLMLFYKHQNEKLFIKAVYNELANTPHKSHPMYQTLPLHYIFDILHLSLTIEIATCNQINLIKHLNYFDPIWSTELLIYIDKELDITAPHSFDILLYLASTTKELELDDFSTSPKWQPLITHFESCLICYSYYLKSQLLTLECHHSKKLCGSCFKKLPKRNYLNSLSITCPNCRQTHVLTNK